MSIYYTPGAVLEHGVVKFEVDTPRTPQMQAPVEMETCAPQLLPLCTVPWEKYGDEKRIMWEVFRVDVVGGGSWRMGCRWS